MESSSRPVNVRSVPDARYSSSAPGAIGLGAKSLRLEKAPSDLALKQACAAVGQSRLMSIYEDAFRHFNVTTAQVLLTEDDFLNPERYSNLRATLDTLLKLGQSSRIINENDTVSTCSNWIAPSNTAGHHRVFGDNDKLSALVMTKIDADLLVLLSDVDGLYTSHPHDGWRRIRLRSRRDHPRTRRLRARFQRPRPWRHVHQD